MSFKRLFCLLVLLCVACLFVSCAGKGVILAKPVTMCADIPEGGYSVLCQVAEQAKTTPEVVAGIFQVSNYILLVEDVYTAEQALVFIDGIKADLDAGKKMGATYLMFAGYVLNKYAALDPKVQAAFVVIQGLSDIKFDKEPLLSEYDYAFIEKHLCEQRRIVEVFLD